MSEDYLWNYAGEPDAELQRLERTLGELRYVPTALALPPPPRAPQMTAPPRRQFFRPALAFAAALILLCGLGVALSRLIDRTPVAAPAARENRQAALPPADVRRPSENSPPTVAEKTIETNAATAPLMAAGNSAERRTAASATRDETKKRRAHSSAIRKLPARPDELSARERASGAAAKEKLMIALRIAGAELRDVRRKIYANSYAPGNDK